MTHLLDESLLSVFNHDPRPTIISTHIAKGGEGTYFTVDPKSIKIGDPSSATMIFLPDLDQPRSQDAERRHTYPGLISLCAYGINSPAVSLAFPLPLPRASVWLSSSASKTTSSSSS